MNSNKTVFHKNLGQAGMASIIITMIMMIVIILIVVGFATIVRRNSREALDRQLSSQAYYAAETGVNQAASWVSSHSVQDLSALPNSANFDTQCGAFIGSANLNNVLSNTDNVAYTCLLISPKVPSIVKNLALGEQAVYPINLDTPAKLTFAWQLKGTTSAAAPADASKCPATFTSVNNWTSKCPYGMLRIDIYDGSASTSGPAALAGNTATLYFMPGSSDGLVAGPPSAYSASGFNPTANQAIVGRVKCSSSSQTCTATVMAPGGGNFNTGTIYYVRISNIYEDSGNVVIGNDKNGTFSGAQYLVDVTGRAQDELQRIQVHLPASDSSSFPANDALASGSAICKRFTVEGPGTLASPGLSDPNPFCAP